MQYEFSLVRHCNVPHYKGVNLLFLHFKLSKELELTPDRNCLTHIEKKKRAIKRNRNQKAI